MNHTISPVCRTCGTTIGHVFLQYREILKQRIEEKTLDKGIKVEDFRSLDDIEMADILDALKLKNPCCIGMVMGFVITPTHLS